MIDQVAAVIRHGRVGHVIELRSDNAAGVAPEILAAVEAANTGSALAYGGDDLTAHLQDVVRTVFEHPTARVFPVTSGTAANSLALSAVDAAVGRRALPPSRRTSSPRRAARRRCSAAAP